MVSIQFPGCVPREVRIPERRPLLPIKAVQILILPGSTLEDSRLQLRRYKYAGFDTVILRVFHLPGDRPHGPAADRVEKTSTGVYFPTDSAPVLMDLLNPFVRLCREEGIRPFAWMVTRDARFGNRHLLRDHVYNTEGRIRKQLVDALDILNPSNHRYLERLFKDLAATGVDGVLLQDDLALRMTDGFTAAANYRFFVDTGSSARPFRRLQIVEKDGKRYVTAGEGFEKWTHWKTGKLTALAGKLESAIQTVNPSAVLVVNQMYETLIDPDNGRLWLSQDLDTSLRDGPSYTAVMLYHRQMQKELSIEAVDVLDLIEKPLKDLRRRVRQRSRVVLKFQTRDWDTGESVPANELTRVMMTAWKGGWSIALVPPPTEEQLLAIEPILKGM